MNDFDSPQRVVAAGKFFRLDHDKFYVKGFSYGPFAPNSSGEALPEPDQVDRDFDHIRNLGANTIRVYFPPPIWFLDKAAQHGLKVFIDIPWEKHRCFFEDWSAMERARESVRQTARNLGCHPAVFAISVVNELPADAVRYQGRRRVEKFIEELLGIVKQEAPDCLVTFVNFPTTEFLDPRGCDFCCFNVYLHDMSKFGPYLDRLQHLAGNRPLLIGEYGVDSQRQGDLEQADVLQKHIREVFRHGLAGSIIFSYTDDWFTGGHQIVDWRFGVTDVERSNKTAADAVRKAWAKYPLVSGEGWPRVSVVVCSYNGGATLRECLKSLTELNYPDYEILLIDDGSTDHSASIAEEFPQVIYYHQPNQGLSVARNVGAELATGDIVAYTDSDCVADEHWLAYLVQAMQDQQVEAIGGPNITPESDNWVAKCVAASPGNPSHVMLNDRYAEHVPGCNMAFRRSILMGLGGFDRQFRVAGDDVDMCWRFLDAGWNIGYAPGAMVWHHRRNSLAAFSKQQKGYGRSEAMVHFKHPQRCGTFGRSSWKGIIYGDGAVGLPLMPDRIFHGQFGGALFQTIYRHNHYGLWAIMMSLEWHLGAIALVLLSTLFFPLIAGALLMWVAPCALAIHSSIRSPLPADANLRMRILVAYLYLMQPVWRGWYRLTYRLRTKQLPRRLKDDDAANSIARRISASSRELNWDSDEYLGRGELLGKLVELAKAKGFVGDFDNNWTEYDLKLVGDRWHDIVIRTATEELGWPRRFTRGRATVHATVLNHVLSISALVWSCAALLSGRGWAMGVGSVAAAILLAGMIRSRRRCLRAAVSLLARAGAAAGLTPYTSRSIDPPTKSPATVVPPPRRREEFAKS